MSCQASLEFLQLINHLLLSCYVALKRGALSVGIVAALFFCQQLLLPEKLSLTLQLSANESSDLRPAFSHLLSHPDSFLVLCVLSFCLMFCLSHIFLMFRFSLILLFLFLPVSSSSFKPPTSSLPSLTLLFASHPTPGVNQECQHHMLQQPRSWQEDDNILSTTQNSRQSTAVQHWTPIHHSETTCVMVCVCVFSYELHSSDQSVGLVTKLFPDWQPCF